jgi:pimeloyl-ACP methyl ester carboxylesterase
MLLIRELAGVVRTPSLLRWSIEEDFMTAPTAKTARYIKHRIPRDGHALFAKEYEGSGPPFVMLHGFPDNHRIYDPVAELLAASGRRVITFDFLGFGDSDKPEGYDYNFAQQLQDLEAVVQHLELGPIVPVAHDAGGFAAINYLAARPEMVAHLVLLNTFYTNAPTLRPPELVLFFALPGLAALSQKVATDPKLMDFLLTFQQTQFKLDASEHQKYVIDHVVRPIISENFEQVPSATPAFARVAADMLPQIGKNTAAIPQLKGVNVPCTIVWGQVDAYLNVGVAKDFQTTFEHSSLHVVDGGHWPQLDHPEEVAKHLLAEVKA